MKSSAERRQFLRLSFEAPVQLLFPDGTQHGKLIDISLKGALVDCPDAGNEIIGHHCRLRLQLSAETAILMGVTVMHVVGHQFGLRCDHIDVDSMTHLRQLIEHNAQDPALLERELSMLFQH